jgi:inner membrane protein
MGLSTSVRDSVMFKMLFIAIIIVVLLIPLLLIRAVISEREQRRNDAVFEVSEKWGGLQTLAGPILSVPYTVYYTDEEDKVRRRTEYAQFLPESIDIETEVLPEIRSRGIFDIVVYTLTLQTQGNFSTLPLEELNIPEEDLRWQDALLIMSITDMRGLNEGVEIDLNGRRRLFEPGSVHTNLFPSGIHVKMPDLEELGVDPIEFDISMRLKGNDRIYLVPVGRDTKVRMRSEWDDPSFIGAYLPVDHEISTDGFHADWRISHLSRNYPQFWKTEASDISLLTSSIFESAFGVELFLSVDHYHRTMRSVKYAILFILLTFAAFFLFEMMSNLRMHPFQYLLIGFAMSLFYLLLLSLSEHLTFTPSYAIASAATIGLIVGYASYVLAEKRRTATISALLILLYICLYILLSLEDFALLFGSIVLLIVLALIMFLTRKVDWYSVRMNRTEKSPASERDA